MKPDIQALAQTLVHKIAQLEAQMAELRQVIAISGSSVTITSQGSLAITVGGSANLSVGSALALNVGSNMTQSVGSAFSQTVGAGCSLSVGAGYTVAVGGIAKVSTGRDIDVTTNQFALRAAKGADVSVQESLTLLVGRKLVVEAADQADLKVGSALIDLHKNGDVVIKGKDLTLQASGAIHAKASRDVVIKGQKILQN